MAAAGKEFDLNKRYKVILSERLKNQTRDPEYAVASVHGKKFYWDGSAAVGLI